MSIKRLSTAILAIALALTGATQLRLPGVPVGPGELLLFLWSCGVIALVATASQVRLRRHAMPMLVFWGVSLSVLLLDSIVYQAIGGRQAFSYHALFAYVFSALTCCAYAVWVSGDRLLPLTGWLVGTLVVALTAIRVAAGAGIGLGIIDPWYSIRYRGWSDNPNQIAFQLAVVPALAIFISRTTTRPVVRRLALLSVPVIVVVGISTRSDALTVAWLAGAAAFVVMDYATGRARAVIKSGIRAFARYVVVPLAFASGLLLGAAELYDHVREEAVAVYDDSGQGFARLALWRNGIEAGLSAPLLGLGPGAHSGVRRPFEGSESHNSFIDWWSNTGLIGLCAYLFLLAAIGRIVLRARDAALVSAFVALIMVSAFHYTFRHPLYWVGLLLISGLASSRVARDEGASVDA